MITLNRHYPLPNKNHDVVDDINDLRSTFAMIDEDVTNTEEGIEELSETVSDLENRAVHLPYSVENSEIQNISANRYLVVNQNGNGFECLDGGGDAGGISGQCSIKKTDSNFDTAWGNILEISKNGMTPQENSETSQANETHIYVDEAEIENDEQLPKVELTNCQVKSDLESINNESVIFCDNAEEIEEELPIATYENFGLVKIGDGFSNNAGTISAPIITKATEDNFGIIKAGDGLVNNNGTISRDEINSATFSNFGIVKLGDNLSINKSGEMEIRDMASNATIYNLGNIKICNNGIIDLEEQTLVYRLFVTEDLVIQFQTDFEVQDDFSFVLEIVSDGTHLISFNENLHPKISPLPINRGVTKITFFKKLGVPSYNVEISRLDAPEPTLLTPAIETCISSEFSVTSPNGGSWLPNSLLKTSYNGYCDITELNFKFETLVCVDYVNYLSRSNSVSMGEFVLKGSNDEKNWTTLICKNGEIIYGKVYTEIKGCFRYYNLKIGYTSDDNKPGGVTLWGTQIDNNESEIIPLTPYMSSNETTFAKMTANNIESGSAADITDFNCNSLLKMTKTGDDWIKYELSEAKIANIFELNFRGMGEYYGFYGDRHPNWFKLEGSNDDETWTLLLERQYAGNELSLNNNVVFYNFENNNAYKYYKFTCVATNSSNAQWGISGFKLYQRKIGKYHFYRGVPKLTSANQDGYKITASSQYDNNYVGYFAFDDDGRTNWVTAENPGDAWLQIKLPTATAFDAVQIASREDKNLDQSPTAFQIQGSNDGENWDTLDSESDISWTALGELKLFEFANETAYLYYRLYITACQGSSYKGCGRFVLGNAIREYKRWLNKYEELIPKLTSDNDRGYTVTASSVFGGTTHPAYCAFDGLSEANNKWLSASNDVVGAWLRIELPQAVTADVFSIQSPNESWRDRALRTFKIQGSNDNSTWTTLVSESNLSWTNNQVRTWETENIAAFKFYRILIEENNGANLVDIGEFQLYRHHIIQEY